MTRILSVATAVPEFRHTQEKLRQFIGQIFEGEEEIQKRMGVFERAEISTRYTSFPLDYYGSAQAFEDRNRDFQLKALELLEKAAGDALRDSGVKADQIDHVISVNTTGLSTPSLEAFLVPRLGLREDVIRTPIWGLGCAGGVAALGRAMQYLKGWPKHRVLVLSVELCGQVFSTRARTKTDLIGAALFGEGAAAVVLGGDQVASKGPKVMFHRSVIFPDTEKTMGWDFTSDGLRLKLAQNVPEIVGKFVKPAVESFVLKLAMSMSNIRNWILHPGGPKVMAAYEEVLGVSPQSMKPIRAHLRNFGNLSSASVLFILKDVLASSGGGTGLMLALGPGFSAEMLILKW